MERATTYEVWRAAAEELDTLEHNDEWSADDRSNYYDVDVVRDDIAQFARCRSEGDVRGLIDHLEGVPGLVTVVEIGRATPAARTINLIMTMKSGIR